eukprot:681265-Pelagomonas_calceolata.AAC.1
MVPFGGACCTFVLSASQTHSLCILTLQLHPRACRWTQRMRPECPGDHLLRAGVGLFWGVLQSQPRGVLMIGKGFMIIFNEIKAHQLEEEMGPRGVLMIGKGFRNNVL